MIILNVSRYNATFAASLSGRQAYHACLLPLYVLRGEFLGANLLSYTNAKCCSTATCSIPLQTTITCSFITTVERNERVEEHIKSWTLLRSGSIFVRTSKTKPLGLGIIIRGGFPDPLPWCCPSRNRARSANQQLRERSVRWGRVNRKLYTTLCLL